MKMPALALEAVAPLRKIRSMPSLGALAFSATGSDWLDVYKRQVLDGTEPEVPGATSPSFPPKNTK